MPPPEELHREEPDRTLFDPFATPTRGEQVLARAKAISQRITDTISRLIGTERPADPGPQGHAA